MKNVAQTVEICHILESNYNDEIILLLPSKFAWIPHFILCILYTYAGSGLFPWHSSQRADQSPIASVCVVCEREKETDNERAYCTGVHVHVYYSVTSALLYLYAGSFRLETTQWVMRAMVTGVLNSSSSSGSRQWSSTYKWGHIIDMLL